MKSHEEAASTVEVSVVMTTAPVLNKHKAKEKYSGKCILWITKTRPVPNTGTGTTIDISFHINFRTRELGLTNMHQKLTEYEVNWVPA